MVNINKLRARMFEKGINVDELAEAAGFNKSTIYRRFKSGGEDFSLKEVKVIIKILGLSPTESQEIFFNENVA